MKYYYDVALSFAGEDREFVEKCAEVLCALGISVFYDNYEESILWGKNLFSYFADIYTKKSKYVIVFISNHYLKKCWCNHELKNINQRVFNQKGEYLLPVYLDDAKICEIPQTVGYLMKPEPFELAYLFAKKMNKNIDVDLMLGQLKEYLPDYDIRVDGKKIIFVCRNEDFYAEYPLSLLMELYKNNLIKETFIIPGIVPN